MPDQRTRLGRDSRLERIPKVVEMYLNGTKIKDIAAELGVSRDVIDQDLSQARAAWRNKMVESGQQLIYDELAKIDRTESEAWKGWERSCQDEVTVMNEKGPGSERKKRRTRKAQAGQAAFLAIMLQCSDRRCKLLRLYADKSEQDAGMLTATVVEVIVDTPEQVAKLMNYDRYEELTKPSAN